MGRLDTVRPSSIAVIVTTYNNPSYLTKTLDGYLRQTTFPDELLVADDGSGEETATVIGKFSAQAPFPVRHVWHEDQGFRAAKIRNKAIETAVSEYLIFTDGDCVPHREFVADHLRASRKSCFIQGKRILVGRELSAQFGDCSLPTLLASCLKGALSGCHHLIRLPWFVRSTRLLCGIRSCNMAVSRSDLYAVNGFNEDFVGWGREDTELAVRLFNYGLTRLDLPFSAMVFHLWHRENSRSSLEDNDRLLERVIASGAFRCINGIIKESCP